MQTQFFPYPSSCVLQRAHHIMLDDSESVSIPLWLRNPLVILLLHTGLPLEPCLLAHRVEVPYSRKNIYAMTELGRRRMFRLNCWRGPRDWLPWGWHREMLITYLGFSHFESDFSTKGIPQFSSYLCTPPYSLTIISVVDHTLPLKELSQRELVCDRIHGTTGSIHIVSSVLAVWRTGNKCL